VITFLLGQLPYYRNAVQNLLKESVRYMDFGMDSDSSSIKDWIGQLESITADNIED
jgi:hypothetical protein